MPEFPVVDSRTLGEFIEKVYMYDPASIANSEMVELGSASFDLNKGVEKGISLKPGDMAIFY
ncbi:MAG: hypothetical protein WC848_00630 [Parcubacteria group bacterium]|jgi:hypothetical protein